MVVDLLAGSGAVEAVMASAVVEMGSPLLCSIVVAMLRWKVRGASARRRDARRRAMVGV